MKNPFNETPPDLTEEAELDRRRWEVVISQLKGKERMTHISQFVDRYKELPNLSWTPSYLQART